MRVDRHMAVNIQGLLAAYKGRKIGIIEDDNGNRLTDQQARIELSNLLSKGYKYMPCSTCDGFDPFEKGCPGHPIIEEETESKTS
jgi:hypothetical protein